MEVHMREGTQVGLHLSVEDDPNEAAANSSREVAAEQTSKGLAIETRNLKSSLPGIGVCMCMYIYIDTYIRVYIYICVRISAYTCA